MKKFFKKIASIYSFVVSFFNKAEKTSGEVITSTYNKTNKIASVIIPIASNLMQKFKNILAGNLDDEIIGIVSLYAPTKISIIVKAVHTWLEKVVPELAEKLEIITAIQALPTMQEKINYIIAYLKEHASDKNAAAVDISALALDCTVWLADGEFTDDEKKLLTQEIKAFYKNHIKKNG